MCPDWNNGRSQAEVQTKPLLSQSPESLVLSRPPPPPPAPVRQGRDSVNFVIQASPAILLTNGVFSQFGVWRGVSHQLSQGSEVWTLRGHRTAPHLRMAGSLPEGVWLQRPLSPLLGRLDGSSGPRWRVWQGRQYHIPSLASSFCPEGTGGT